MKSAIQLIALALVAAASGVRANDLPFTLRGSSADEEEAAPITGLMEVGEGGEESNSCGASCETNADCFTGGFVQCGMCYRKYAGTRHYHTCISDDTCGDHCDSDDDCALGGYTTCTKCDLEYAGTETYKTCVDDFTPAPSPSPYNPFPNGGSCKKSCRHDSDCQNGGFNPCGKCGQQGGTETHHRCYQPQTAEE